MISHESILSTVPEYFGMYDNVIFAKVDFSKLVAKTYVEEIWAKGQVSGHGFSLNNISNVLRGRIKLKKLSCFFGSKNQ